MATDIKVSLITGSSTGFGRSLAEAVLKHGDCAITTARKPEQLDALMIQYPETAKAIQLDVTQSQNVREAVDAAIEAFGQIDVLVNVLLEVASRSCVDCVNNAGYGLV
ncbi:MAG: SDR family NAD(P)-dependent oxidoreductase [Chroococcidiopsidaceae cyanobacterium CP_BM_RX_35]|nr:SDR family NAD(P)-dependent oxidoreductase [Chroococcidiopsidaceae cyanobacterium CP_BM_RX_35]